MSEVVPPSRARQWAAWALWLAASILGTICGVGGGIFSTPIQHYVCGVPLPRAISTSLVLVLVMTAVATGLETLRADGAIDWTVVVLLLCGSIPGAMLGHLASRRTSVRTLKLGFVVLLAVAAVRTATLSGAGSDATPGHVTLGTLQSALVVAMGLGGGFLAPLLGVGGGILVIPMLFLTLPEITYLEARAASMAMSIVNAGQSVWFHVRDGRVDFRAAAPYALLAVLGALLGTSLVHLPGWGEVARVSLTLVMVFVAARFAFDVRKARQVPARTRAE